MPTIPYYMTSPRNDVDKNNQPSRYNDVTIIGNSPKVVDVFKVSEIHGGLIMPE